MTASSECPAFGQQSVRPLAGLGEDAADLLVDDELRTFGVRAALQRSWPRYAGPPDPNPIGPSRGENPQSRTIRVASSVAPARSFAAPVEASPSTSSSAARPPRRTARES